MAVSNVSDLKISKYLKVVSRDSVYNNLSEDSEIWSMVKKMKSGEAEGRESRFSIRDGYGAGAVGFLPVDGGSYPDGHKSSLQEGISQYKDYALTVEVERTVVAKAISDFSKYGDPLAEEMRAKTIALSRRLSIAAMGDGTGVIGKTLVDGGANAVVLDNDELIIKIDASADQPGFIGWFQPGDKIVLASESGVEISPDQATNYDHLIVLEQDRPNNQVRLRAVTADGTKIPQTTAANIADDSYFYRLLQKKGNGIPDRTAITSGVDLNAQSFAFPGMAAFTAQNQTVNGILQSGQIAARLRDSGGSALSSQDFQKIMSQLMIAVGQGRYKYSKALMAWEAYDSLVEAHDTDRRFQSIKDNQSGVESLGYVHTKNKIAFTPDEFCPFQKIYLCPEGDVLRFYGRDFEFVNPEGKGQKFFLKPNGSGHDRVIRAYMEGSGTLQSVHSSAIGLITNFSI